MAPEQYQGQPRPTSDQYALGVVVYEWLCGERPFQGTQRELEVQHLAAAPPPLRQKAPHVSPALEHVVLKALAKDPKERFASVQDFVQALEQASQLAPSPPVPPPSWSRSPSQPAPPTGVVTPTDPKEWPTEVVTAPGTGPPPPLASTPSPTPAAVPLPTRKLVSAGEPQQPHQGISRRSVMLGLAGLAVVGVAGGGLLRLTLVQQPSFPAALPSPTVPSTSVSTPTPTVPPTSVPTSTRVPTATPTSTTTPTPAKKKSLIVVIVNSPVQVTNNSRVAIDVVTNYALAEVRLQVRYNAPPFSYVTPLYMADGSGNASIPWLVHVGGGGFDPVTAIVVAIATDQGQNGSSTPVQVQIVIASPTPGL